MSGLMSQKWLSADTIGFIDPLEIDVWNGYISILKSSHVRLSNADDCLIWHLSKTSKYSPKVRYAELIYREVDLKWWWKVLWKMKCPLKTKIFSWFLLSSKALTWDVLVSRGREGPGRCSLCKQSCESNFHIAVVCPFTQAVWSIIEDHLKLNNLWYGDSLSACFKNWCFISDVVLIKSLPIIVLWFTWRARIGFVLRILSQPLHRYQATFWV